MDDEVLMKFKPTRITIKHPKRLIIIIISAIILLALATYGIFSYLHWQTYDQDSKKAATSLKTAISDSLSADKTTAAPTTQIDLVVKNFEKTYGSTPCEVSVWYSWQTVIPQLKDMRSRCDQQFATALDAVSKLKPLSQFFKDEEKAAALLTASLEATKTPTDYVTASATWKAAAESDQLSKNTDFKTVHDKFTEVATAISTAYTALAEASKNESKSGLDEATTALQTAYGSIDELKGIVLTKRTAMIKTFITAYEKL
jgi:predicted negative regulator of RcsB-dependent stress response